MNQVRVLMSVVLIVLLGAAIAIGSGGSEGPGTAFTYQGRLELNDQPAQGPLDLTFILFDSETAGAQIGVSLFLADFADFDDNGHFTVDLDFGDGVFTGAPRWLEIVISEGQSLETLEPRLPIMPAPYAMYAASAPGNGGGGGAEWVFRTDEISTMANVGIGTTDPLYPLHVTTTSVPGIYGEHTSSTGTLPGVWGATNSNDTFATGLRGYVNSATAGPQSRGVLGYNAATNGNGAGVHGQHASNGIGVWGSSEGGTGVLGEATGQFSWAGRFNGRAHFSDDVAIGTVFPAARLHVENNDGSIALRATQIADGTGIYGSAHGATGNAIYAYSHVDDVDDAALHAENDGGGPAGRFVGDLFVQQGRFGVGLESFLVGKINGHVAASEGSGTAIFGSQELTDSPAIWALNWSSGPALWVQSNADVTPTGGGAMMVGIVNELHMNFDGNEITAFNDDALAPLHLNHNGGDVRIGQGSGGTGKLLTPVLQITGGADLAERFPSTEDAEPGTVMSIDPEHAGQLRIARGAYDVMVAGVVSGANDLRAGAILGAFDELEDAPAIALSGRVWVKCDATYGAIRPGDLLTTSDTPGHAMKVVERDRAFGATIGKAMTELNDGTGLVLVLVSLQ